MHNDDQIGEKTTIRQMGGYCVVQREVAQALRKHQQELGLYVFLLSLPDGWQFRKSWLEKETGIGQNKLSKMLKFLSDHGLVAIGQKKSKGKFAEFYMDVFDGTGFKPNKLEPLFKSPCHGNRATETVATEIDDKILNKEKRKINKKSFCENDENKKRSYVDNSKRHPFADSMNAMASERKHIAEHEKRKNDEIQRSNRYPDALTKIKDDLRAKMQMNC